MDRTTHDADCTIALCSACGDFGRLWLGTDDEGRTVHLVHQRDGDTSAICGIATKASTAPLLSRHHSRTWRPEAYEALEDERYIARLNAEKNR